MAKITIAAFLLVIPLVLGKRGEFKQIYMTKGCNKVHTGVISARYETNYGLTYHNLMTCYSHIKAPADRYFLIQYGRFELEEALGVACVDKYNLYLGSSTADFNLHGEMCGTQESLGIFKTTSQEVYITMETDNTAVARGVELVLTAYYNPPCNDGDFACNNSICIDSRLECDHINHCADNSDESHCTEEDLNPTALDNTLFIGIGSGFGGLILIIIILIILWKVYTWYKWKKLMEEDMDNETFEKGDLYKYPVTDVYSKYDIGEKGRREPTWDDVMIKPGSSEEMHDNQGFVQEE